MLFSHRMSPDERVTTEISRDLLAGNRSTNLPPAVETTEQPPAWLPSTAIGRIPSVSLTDHFYICGTIYCIHHTLSASASTTESGSKAFRENKSGVGHA